MKRSPNYTCPKHQHGPRELGNGHRHAKQGPLSPVPPVRSDRASPGFPHFAEATSLDSEAFGSPASHTGDQAQVGKEMGPEQQVSSRRRWPRTTLRSALRWDQEQVAAKRKQEPQEEREGVAERSEGWGQTNCNDSSVWPRQALPKKH